MICTSINVTLKYFHLKFPQCAALYTIKFISSSCCEANELHFSPIMPNWATSFVQQNAVHFINDCDLLFVTDRDIAIILCNYTVNLSILHELLCRSQPNFVLFLELTVVVH